MLIASCLSAGGCDGRQNPAPGPSNTNTRKVYALASGSSNWEVYDLSAMSTSFTTAVVIANWNCRNVGTYQVEVRDADSVSGTLLWSPMPVEGDSKTRTKRFAVPASKRIAIRVTYANGVAVQPLRKDDSDYQSPGPFTSVIQFRGPEVLRVENDEEIRGIFTTPIGLTLVLLQ
jgi:hypothetical protein